MPPNPPSPPQKPCVPEALNALARVDSTLAACVTAAPKARAEAQCYMQAILDLQNNQNITDFGMRFDY